MRYAIHLFRIAGRSAKLLKKRWSFLGRSLLLGGIGAVGWSCLETVLPEVFDESVDVDAGCPPNGSDNMFRDLVIDFLIPFRKV